MGYLFMRILKLNGFFNIILFIFVPSSEHKTQVHIFRSQASKLVES